MTLAILPTMQHIVSVDTTLLLNRVRILVVRLGDALPFDVDLQEKKDVREVDLAAPALFEDAHDGKRFFEFQHVDSRLEVLACADGIDVAVELAVVFAIGKKKWVPQTIGTRQPREEGKAEAGNR